MGETPSDGDDRHGRDSHRDRWSRLPSGRGPTPADDESGSSLPLDGDVLLYTGATASVAPERIEPLLRAAQTYLQERVDRYRRGYESAFVDDERRMLLVPAGHWAEVGAELGLPEREVDAVRRAHAQQLRRIGSTADRREEFETALEIREAVVIGE
ncbi:hypothetical protein [Halobellus salinus]|uniref:hypothetical protein n=1 Tax=Halobellus salinus TaxID=931585 RepID=UPI001E48B672|nr:hypothetical protein [Halobellus salinus]